MSHKIFQSAKLYGFIMMVNNQSHVVIIIGHKGKPKIHKFSIPKWSHLQLQVYEDQDKPEFLQKLVTTALPFLIPNLDVKTDIIIKEEAEKWTNDAEHNHFQ